MTFEFPNISTSLWENVTTKRDFDMSKFIDILTSPNFPEKDARRWIDDRYPLTIQLSFLYVFVVFGTKHFMRNREPFSLFVPLNVWNLFLAIFSTLGAFNLSFEFFGTIFTHGLQSSYCNVHNYTLGNNGYWVWLFIVSKMFELVDTVFLVLRKRPLLFLHWYHHILTMLYAFYSYPITPAFNRWGIYLNYLVHSYMYSYYFLRSMKIKVPGPVAKFVTTIQIWQFIISVVILAHLGWLTFVENVKCDLDSKVYAFAVSMDVSYLILFINFFLHAYVLKGGKAKYRTDKTNNGINKLEQKINSVSLN
ncbi:Elongation of very long chain fatty acids protein [Meloidogyne graminicola]|uniref:Elongation of very long chain fatty acids protein n=1 Tax=Meloidogyne graminicola TaxID=189291 RepID=A0A8S9ZFZ3_9BILA|nr:Elongation of very long chain fatty acids protein [Meloidogyne graminicola]